MKLLSMIVVSICALSGEQTHRIVAQQDNYLFDKRWYAMKIINDDMSSTTRISAEDDMYFYFSLDLDSRGFVKHPWRAQRFGSLHPYALTINRDQTEIEIWNGLPDESTNIVYTVDRISEHVLQITGPMDDTYVFISNMTRE